MNNSQRAKWIVIDEKDVSTFPPIEQAIVITAFIEEKVFDAESMKQIGKTVAENLYRDAIFTKSGTFDVEWLQEDNFSYFLETEFQNYSNCLYEAHYLGKRRINSIEVRVMAWWPVPNENYEKGKKNMDEVINNEKTEQKRTTEDIKKMVVRFIADSGISYTPGMWIAVGDLTMDDDFIKDLDLYYRAKEAEHNMLMNAISGSPRGQRPDGRFNEKIAALKNELSSKVAETTQNAKNELVEMALDILG